MTGPNSDARAALDQQIIHPFYVAWLDILGEPIRVTTAPYSLAPTGTGDPDLDGQVFSAVEASLIGVSPIKQKEGGADTVTLTLSALIGIDTELMDQLGDRYNWQGRICRIWRGQLGENLGRIGNIWDWHTGYMAVPKISGDGSGQVITLTTESYTGFMTQASGRTYLSQADFDAGDLSAAASIAIANGTDGGMIAGSGGSSSGALYAGNDML